jgi:hypothetical protein
MSSRLCCLPSAFTLVFYSVNNLRSYLEEIVAAPGLESRSYDRRDSLRWPRDTLYPLKVGTSFADRRRSLDRTKNHGVFFSNISFLIVFLLLWKPVSFLKSLTFLGSCGCVAVDIFFGGSSPIGLESSRTLSRTPIRCLALWLLEDVVVFWELLHSICEAEIGISARRSSSTLWGKYPTVRQRELSKGNAFDVEGQFHGLHGRQN